MDDVQIIKQMAVVQRNVRRRYYGGDDMIPLFLLGYILYIIDAHWIIKCVYIMHVIAWVWVQYVKKNEQQ